jgi:hypothetical protein
MLHRSTPSTVLQQFLPASLPPPSLFGVAASGRKTPLFAAFNGLKTRALYVILLLIKNSCSALTRTHHERSFDHVGSNTRTQAEAVFYSFRFVFFQKRIPLVSLDGIFGWTEDGSFPFRYS